MPGKHGFLSSAIPRHTALSADMRDNTIAIVMMMAERQSYEENMFKFHQQPVIFF